MKANHSILFKRYRPALLFLLVFVGLYVISNLIYGLYIESYRTKVDPWTIILSEQVAAILRVLGEPIEIYDLPDYRACRIGHGDNQGLSIFEGCNGINVIIIFISFLIAYRGPLIKTIWFGILGIVLIHITNLYRIILLYYVAEYYSNHMYFVHKYLFTAVIYAIVFVLWYLWITKFNEDPKSISTN